MALPCQPRITTRRLHLVALDPPTLEALIAGRPIARIRTPPWWPGATERGHLEGWLRDAAEQDGHGERRPPGIVDRDGELLGQVPARFRILPSALDVIV